MKLHQNETLFREAIIVAAQRLNIKEIFIEKDYWVTLVLYTLFKSELSNFIVFKGGTALSKCFGFIQRFSEDIDLVVLQDGDESGNALKKKLKAISNQISEIMPEVEVEGITHKMGVIRKTAHSFQKTFEGDYGQVRREIIVESGWLGSFEPYSTNIISSYLHHMITETGQVHLISEFD
ncbi:MAG: nucleotidyl transferase AbiEii/AbiGii toxin family protein [Flavobacteriales bacterium]|nr:nucleotidyl transferase AbiEii/AbiGii toxin family protein [Flavobacteriales bacterium]